jgi:integrase
MRHTHLRQKVFHPACRRAGIDPLPRLHDLRHTAVALAIQAGAHPKAVQEMVGHASITMTLDTYGHLFDSLQEETASRLDAIYRGAILHKKAKVTPLRTSS